jgi:hypothetical protein
MVKPPLPQIEIKPLKIVDMSFGTILPQPHEEMRNNLMKKLGDSQQTNISKY